MSRVGSYPTFSPLPRRFTHINMPIIASNTGHTICGTSSSPSNPLALGFDGVPVRGRRYISVALVLRSPSAGVTRYPCPVEPGLSSPGSFRNPAAAVQSGRGDIVTHCRGNVKHLANSFLKEYTIHKRKCRKEGVQHGLCI